MKISLYLGVLFLALVIKIITGNVRLQRSAQQYCGSRLADIMKVLCKGKYYYESKRNQIDLENWNFKELEDYNTIDYPLFRSKQEAISFMPPRVLRSRSKITDECCDKPCYISELRSYCAPN